MVEFEKLLQSSRRNYFIFNDCPAFQLEIDRNIDAIIEDWRDLQYAQVFDFSALVSDFGASFSRPATDRHVRIPYSACFFKMRDDWFVYATQMPDEQTITVYLITTKNNGAVPAIVDYGIWYGNDQVHTPIFPGKWMYESESSGEVTYIISLIIHALRGCLWMLNCSNIEQVEAKPSPLRQRRLEKKKLPVYSTWTLRIKAPSVSNKSGSGGGTHASPRLHLRRGHLREYSPGKFTWVSDCVVGHVEQGVVAKDYAVSGNSKLKESIAE